MSRDSVASVVEVVSALSVSVGAVLWSVPAGLAVAGGFGLLFARGLARR